MKNERAFKVYKKCALSDLQKKNTTKKRFIKSPFESVSGLHMQVFPPGRLSSAQSLCCLWKHPS